MCENFWINLWAMMQILGYVFAGILAGCVIGFWVLMYISSRRK